MSSSSSGFRNFSDRKSYSTNTKIIEFQHDLKIGPNDWGDAGKMQYVIWQIIGPQGQAATRTEAALAAPAPHLYEPKPRPRDLASTLSKLKNHAS